MSVTLILPVLLMLVGGAIYVFTVNPKFQELGRLLFAAGSFALAFALAGKTISF